MKARLALSAFSATPRLPIQTTAIWWLLGDRLQIPNAACGLTAAVIISLWVTSVADFYTCKTVELSELVKKP